MNTRSPRRPAASPRSGTGRGNPGQTRRTGSGRPLPPGPLYTPDAGGARRAVEGRSARVVLLLHQLPRWLVPALMAALLVTGLAVRGPGGGAALVGVAAALGWLACLSWPALRGQGRLLRMAAIAGVLVLAVVQALR
jgi:hypothetical protein